MKRNPPAVQAGAKVSFCRTLLCVGAFFCLAWSFSGCAVGPRYQRPDTKAPAAFRGQMENSTTTNSFGYLPWWQVFHDDNLQRLIHVALTNNYDIRIAAARVEQARAMAAEARSQFFPQLNYGALAGTGKNVSGGNTPSPTGSGGSVFAADVNAAWEIDLFGRIRRLTEAARAQYFASEEARREVTISLISQVAQDYFQLLALDRELQIAHDSTNSFGESLTIFNERLQGGVASKLETSSAEALMDSAAATIPSLERQVEAQEDQLCVLLGMNPATIDRTNSTFEDQDLPDVPPGIPSQLLERRPDIREAEQNLRAANAQVGVAMANFFPQLNLTGLLGTVSPELNAFTGGGAAAWSVAANLAGPIFHGGQLRAQYVEARAMRVEAALSYQQAVLTAFQEVSDALIAREKLASARLYQDRAVEAYKEAVKIAMKRYKLGHADYYEVLQEQQQLFPAENTLTQTELNQILAIVQLYKALGGGWEAEPGN